MSLSSKFLALNVTANLAFPTDAGDITENDATG